MPWRKPILTKIESEKVNLMVSLLWAQNRPYNAAIKVRYKNNVIIKLLRPIQLGLGPLIVVKVDVLNSTPHTICAKRIVPKGTLVRLGGSGKSLNKTNTQGENLC